MKEFSIKNYETETNHSVKAENIEAVREMIKRHGDDPSHMRIIEWDAAGNVVAEY